MPLTKLWWSCEVETQPRAVRSEIAKTSRLAIVKWFFTTRLAMLQRVTACEAFVGEFSMVTPSGNMSLTIQQTGQKSSGKAVTPRTQSRGTGWNDTEMEGGPQRSVRARGDPEADRGPLLGIRVIGDPLHRLLRARKGMKK